MKRFCRVRTTLFHVNALFVILFLWCPIVNRPNVIFAQSVNSSSIFYSIENDPTQPALTIHNPDDSFEHITVLPELGHNTEPSSSSSEVVESESTTIYPLWNGIDAELKCSLDEDCPENAHCADFTCQCVPSYCNGRGACLISNSSEIFCSCLHGFSGQQCEFKDQPCGSFICQNGGTCHQNTNCLCHDGMCCYSIVHLSHISY